MILKGRGFGSRTRHLQCLGVDGIEGFVAIFPEVNGVLKFSYDALVGWFGFECRFFVGLSHRRNGLLF